MGPPSSVRKRKKGLATTYHLSWDLEGTGVLFDLTLPFLCPPSSAISFQVWETTPTPAYSPPCADARQVFTPDRVRRRLNWLSRCLVSVASVV